MLTVNNVAIEVTHFPDKTSQVWEIPAGLLASQRFEVCWDFSTEAEFLHLAQLKDLLDTYSRPSRLEISYLPYG